MSNSKQICEGCLARDGVMTPIAASKLEELNIKVKAQKAESMLCSECRRMVIKFSKFQRKFAKAQKAIHEPTNSCSITNVMDSTNSDVISSEEDFKDYQDLEYYFHNKEQDLAACTAKEVEDSSIPNSEEIVQKSPLRCAQTGVDVDDANWIGQLPRITRVLCIGGSGDNDVGEKQSDADEEVEQYICQQPAGGENYCADTSQNSPKIEQEEEHQDNDSGQKILFDVVVKAESVSPNYQEEPILKEDQADLSTEDHEDLELSPENETEPETTPDTDPVLEMYNTKEYQVWKKSVLQAHKRLCEHRYASVFMRPVTDDIAPGYSKMIDEPMDLTTIRKKIQNGTIKTTAEFVRHVRLMINNALLYNSAEHMVHAMAEDLGKEADFLLTILTEAHYRNINIPKSARPAATFPISTKERPGKRCRTLSASVAQVAKNISRRRDTIVVPVRSSTRRKSTVERYSSEPIRPRRRSSVHPAVGNLTFKISRQPLKYDSDSDSPPKKRTKCRRKSLPETPKESDALYMPVSRIDKRRSTISCGNEGRRTTRSRSRV